MSSNQKKEFRQKYRHDEYSRAIPTKVLKTVTLSDYSVPIDAQPPFKKLGVVEDDDSSDPDNRYAQPQDAFKKIKPLKSYAPPNEKDLGDGYELAKPIPGESEGPMAPKPSPKPRAAKVPLESSLFTKNEMAKKKNDPSPSSDQSIQKETLEQTNTKRVSKKVVEIEYEVASSIRSTYPESSQLKSSFPSVHNESHSSITANSKKIPVTPTPAYSSKPSGSPLKTISRPADSSPMGQPQKDFGYNKSATPSPGTEATYEEPWDLKMKRLKQEQEKKDKELRKKSDSSPVLKKAVSLYEDAPEYPTQQNKMELNLMSARSISQTSEADVFFEASDLLPTQKIESSKDLDVPLKPLPTNTYEDAWDLKNSLLEQKIRAMQLQASATYEEPWDSTKQQKNLQAKFQLQSGNVEKQSEPERLPRQRSSSDAFDGSDLKSAVVRGKYRSVDDSKVKPKSRGCNIGQRINPLIPLSNQNWFHGNISREDAEKMLCVCKEGSYIVRHSSDRKSYSLSIKSSKQYIHVQIEQMVLESGEIRYILGKNSKEFSSIPDMIDYYTHHRVPLKGTEHITLLHPVECKWS